MTSLNLRKNSLWHTQLAKALAAIPGNVTSLDLRENELGNLSSKKLAEAFAAIPETITSLDLSNNELHRKTLPELIQIIAAIPKTVRSINLGGNELFVGKSAKKRDELLKALSHYEQHGRLILSQNGEAAFLRALLPMVSAARQGILLSELVSKILAWLLPKQNKVTDEELVNGHAFKILVSLQRPRFVKEFWANNESDAHGVKRKNPHDKDDVPAAKKIKPDGDAAGSKTNASSLWVTQHKAETPDNGSSSSQMNYTT